MVKNMRVTLPLLYVAHLSVTSLQASEHESRPIQVPSSQLIILEDRGGVPLDHYLSQKAKTEYGSLSGVAPLPGQNLINEHFPVVTNLMTVGTVTDEEAAHIKEQFVERPLFIIGFDDVSINWLQANQNYLAGKRAVGLVVNIETKNQMVLLRQLAGNEIVLTAIPGNEMARALNIRHYPFYMDEDGVMRAP